MTYVHGRHTFRGGLDLRLLQYTTTAPAVSQNTTFSFTNTFTSQLSGITYSAAPGITSGVSIAGLLSGDPNTGGTAVPTAPFYSQHYAAPWVEDDWKITSKLILNLGIRYDLVGARTERHNQLDSGFNTTASSPINAQLTTTTGFSGPLVGGVTFAGVNGAARGAYGMSLSNIEPRVGAANCSRGSRDGKRCEFHEVAAIGDHNACGSSIIIPDFENDVTSGTNDVLVSGCDAREAETLLEKSDTLPASAVRAERNVLRTMQGACRSSAY